MRDLDQDNFDAFEDIVELTQIRRDVLLYMATNLPEDWPVKMLNGLKRAPEWVVKKGEQ